MEMIPCPECEGLAGGYCNYCDGQGYIMESEHNEEDVMESAEESGILLIDDGDDGWY